VDWLEVYEMLLTPVFRPVTQTALRTKAVLIETADIDVPIVTGLKAGICLA
jgi:hypothetical protein